jgi:TDG/mug DNA glycosylase family protein
VEVWTQLHDPKGSSLPDILAPDLSVVFCGINPGMRAAATGHHFAGRGNRFWKTIYLAGFTPEQVAPENDRLLLKYHCGLTTAVARPTARADELSTRDFVEHATVLKRKIEHFSPKYLAFLGKAAYAAMSNQREVRWGQQDAVFGGASVWVLPNPSGLNRGFSSENLVHAYRQLRLALK